MVKDIKTETFIVPRSDNAVTVRCLLKIPGQYGFEEEINIWFRSDDENYRVKEVVRTISTLFTRILTRVEFNLRSIVYQDSNKINEKLKITLPLLPKQFTIEWHCPKDKNDVIMTRLVDCKTGCILDYNSYQLLNDYNYLKNKMYEFIIDLQECGVI